VLAALKPVAVLPGERASEVRGHPVVGDARGKAGAAGPKGAGREAQRIRRLVRRGRDGVEHAAEHGRRQGGVDRAAIDLDAGKELRIEQAAVERAVGAGEGQAINQQRDTAGGRRAVESRAADEQPRRLEAAEALQQHDARSAPQGLGQRAHAPAAELAAIHHGGGAEGGRERILVRRGGGAVDAVFDDPRRKHHDPVGELRLGERGR